jgi:putative ABC transport system permease protein
MASLVGNDVTTVQYQVFSVPALAALALAGVATAVIGAYLPAHWAAKASVVEVLRSE